MSIVVGVIDDRAHAARRVYQIRKTLHWGHTLVLAVDSVAVALATGGFPPADVLMRDCIIGRGEQQRPHDSSILSADITIGS